MKRLDGKIAVVTGASKGIGKAIAGALATEGATVFLAARSERELNQVAEELSKDGHHAIPVRTDMTQEQDIRSLIETAQKPAGHIDILVNNAGMGVFKRCVDMDVKDFDAMWALNMRSVFLATKFSLPGMMKQNSGSIVNIASLAGKNSFVNGTGYAATKWALRGWASSLMLEVRENNIRVVTIFPGSVDTSFSAGGKKGDSITQPADVALAVIFAITAPDRSMFSEIDVRPTNPK